MPRPVSLPLRQAIWNRFQDGQDALTIADGLGIPPRTVRRLLGRFRSAGPGPLAPSYGRSGAATSKLSESLVQAALGLRREHPTWGAGLIRVMLHRLLPERAAPRAPHPSAVAPAGRPRPRSGREAALDRHAAGRPPARGLADGRGRAGAPPKRPAGLLAPGRRRVQRGGPLDRGFPPRVAGARSPRHRPRSSFAWPSPAGGSPNGSRWTTGRPGVRRGATCRRTWGCGWSGWGSAWTTTRRRPPRTTGWWSGRRGRPNGGPNRVPATPRKNCGDDSGRWTRFSVESTRAWAAGAGWRPTRGWPTPAAPTHRAGRRRTGAWRRSRPIWPATRVGGAWARRVRSRSKTEIFMLEFFTRVKLFI